MTQVGHLATGLHISIEVSVLHLCQLKPQLLQLTPQHIVLLIFVLKQSIKQSSNIQDITFSSHYYLDYFVSSCELMVLGSDLLSGLFKLPLEVGYILRSVDSDGGGVTGHLRLLLLLFLLRD